MADEKRRRGRGIRLSVLISLLSALAVLVSAGLLAATIYAVERYEDLRMATDRYITCQQDAYLFQEGSDYMTSECRYFALTGDPVHVERFVEEVETTQRREKAIDDIREYLQEAQSYGFLNEALSHSNDLMAVECYAMRLAADVWGIDPSALPDRVGGIALQADDAALDETAKRAAVADLLFGEDYQASKRLIYENVDKSINALIDDTRAQQIASGDGLGRMLMGQRLMIGLLLLLMLVVGGCTYWLIIKPLKQAVQHIRANQEVPVAGCYEMQFLASTYNDMFELHANHTQALTYSATHDALTGLYNRAAYESMRAGLDESTVGVLAVDVDEFKTFNDTYGHDVGDAVLKRVAHVLQDSFRSDDFVSRIGGDEFCVIMMRANSRMRNLVEGKIRRACERLAQPEDGTPPISISVGVAFGDRANPQGDIFKDADSAMYTVKRAGRGGCAFY